jgi:hypothetical protein
VHTLEDLAPGIVLEGVVTGVQELEAVEEPQDLRARARMRLVATLRLNTLSAACTTVCAPSTIA